MANVHATTDTYSELGAWFGDLDTPTIVSGGVPLPVASTTLAAFATAAYVEAADGALVYVSQPARAVGPLTGGDGTYWLALHRDLSTVVAGWTRQRGTHYLWRKSTTFPADPANGLIFCAATVATTITAVQDLRRLVAATTEVNAFEFLTRAERYDVASRTGALVVRTGLQAAIDAMIAVGGGRLILPAGLWNLGLLNASERGLDITNATGLTLSGPGATLQCTTNIVGSPPPGGIYPYMVYVENPNQFAVDGIHLTDLGFTDANWGVNNDVNGAHGWTIRIQAPYTATAPCRGVRITGSAARMSSFVLMNNTPAADPDFGIPYGLEDVWIEGWCTTCFYGVVTDYSAKNLDLTLHCTDVRRGWQSYGAQNVRARLTLHCAVGFPGSNAFISLALSNTAGVAYGLLTNKVQNIDLELTATGGEGHLNLVYFYMQGDDGDGVGEMTNILATVRCGNLIQTGRHVNITSTNIFYFAHEFASAVQPTTLSRWSHITLDGSVIGVLSGLPVLVGSAPADKGFLTLTPGFSQTMAAYDPANLFTNFDVVGSALSRTFTPAAFGATSGGVGTYTAQQGYWQLINGRLFVDVFLTWTAHTGTGQLIIGPFPLPYDNVQANSIVPIATVQFFAQALPDILVVGEILPGASQIRLYAQTQSTGAVVQQNVLATGTVLLSVSYPI